MNSLGRHILVELYECDREILSDASRLEKVVVKAAKDAGATVLNSTFHQFSPVGTSGVVVIQESHLAIHTWPEYRYAAVDLFTCGDQINPWLSHKSLKESLKAEYASPMEMLRGQFGLLPEAQLQPPITPDTKEAISMKFTRNVWFTEWDLNSGLSLRHKGDKLLDMKSDFQKVEVFDTYKYGRMLTLDGMVMTTEKDEYVYHEMITHPALQSLNSPKRVLIVGGGDGGAARECLKYDSVEEVVVVEIDEVVINASKEFFPEISSSFSHPKTTLEVGDGIEYVKATADESFDFVIIDSTDPIGPATGLFSHEFYENVYRILKPDGVLVSQSESPRFNEKVFIEVNGCHRKIFGDDSVWPYFAFIPTYTSGMWSFSFASKGNTKPLVDLAPEKKDQFSMERKLQYYNGDIHRSAFAVPNFVRQMLEAGM